MNSRERVRLALARREPDRVPIGIGSSGSAIHDEAYSALKQHLGIEGEIEPFRRGHGDNYYDDRILEALGADIRHVFLNFYHSSHWVQRELGRGGLYDPFLDAWGLVNDTKDGMHVFSGQPLARATCAADIDGYPWPKPYGDSGLVHGLRERVEKLTRHTNYAMSVRSPTSGIFELAWLLRGMENLLVDMLSDPAFAIRLVDRVSDTVMQYYDIILSEVGPYLDIVETQDDYGSQQNSLLSPELFRRVIKPARTRLNELIRQKAPHARIYLHSCGAVRKLIPDLIDTGVEVLNPVQPLAAGMESGDLKRDFGDRLVFYGAIDVQRALPGSLDDVDAEVRRRIRDLAPGGGYILAPANVVHRDVPVQNLLRLADAAKKHGAYPIAV